MYISTYLLHVCKVLKTQNKPSVSNVNGTLFDEHYTSCPMTIALKSHSGTQRWSAQVVCEPHRPFTDYSYTPQKPSKHFCVLASSQIDPDMGHRGKLAFRFLCFGKGQQGTQDETKCQNGTSFSFTTLFLDRAFFPKAPFWHASFTLHLAAQVTGFFMGKNWNKFSAHLVFTIQPECCMFGDFPLLSQEACFFLQTLSDCHNLTSLHLSSPLAEVNVLKAFS